MTGNTYFSKPVPLVDELQTSRNNYNTSLVASGTGNQTAAAEKNANRLVLEEPLGTMGSYINTMVRGNSVVISSTMFSQIKKRKSGYLGIVETMKLSPCANSGVSCFYFN